MRTDDGTDVLAELSDGQTLGVSARAARSGGAAHRPVRTTSETAPEIDWDAALPDWSGTSRWRRWRAAKRGFDVMVGVLLLVLLAPVLALVALAVWIETGGPVLHRMYWVGLRGRRFTGFKFRTMVRDADVRKQELLRFNEMKGPAFKMRNDPRVTRVGRVLRRTSLDELPQLWNVVVGDLSLVGPRQPQVHEYLQFEPWHRLRLAVPPGMTCVWQVSGRSEITDFDAWARMDLDYIRRWSFALDLRLLAATVPAVLFGRGAQ